MELLVSILKVVCREALCQRSLSKMASFQTVADRSSIGEILQQRLPYSALVSL